MIAECAGLPKKAQAAAVANTHRRQELCILAPPQHLRQPPVCSLADLAVLPARRCSCRAGVAHPCLCGIERRKNPSGHLTLDHSGAAAGPLQPAAATGRHDPHQLHTSCTPCELRAPHPAACRCNAACSCALTARPSSAPSPASQSLAKCSQCVVRSSSPPVSRASRGCAEASGLAAARRPEEAEVAAEEEVAKGE